MNNAINFVSDLPQEKREELEKLFYYNPEQFKFTNEIETTVTCFGNPIIRIRNHGIEMSVEKYPEAQCLFAVDQSNTTIYAALIYLRSDPTELEVLHLAIRKKNIFPLTPDLILESCIKTLKKIAHSIKGIKKIILPYGRSSILLK